MKLRLSLTLQEILFALDATCIVGADHLSIEIISVSTDTRLLKSGDLFVALQGVHFDGEEFVLEAIQKGAAAVIVSDGFAERHPTQWPRACG